RKAHRTLLERARSRTALAGRLCPPRRTRAFVHRSLLLAAAIAARYAALERRWPALALVLGEGEQPGVSVRQTRLATHTSIFLHPRPLLSMPVETRREVLRVTQSGAAAGSRGEVRRVQPVTREAERSMPV